MNYRFILSSLMLYAITAATCAVAADLRVVLKKSPAIVHAPDVSIGDVATVHGASNAMRERIANLELDFIEDSQQRSLTITRRQIEIRIRLDGVENYRFKVDGDPVIQVFYASNDEIRSRIELLLKQEISRQFNLQPEAVSLRFLESEKISQAAAQLTSEKFEANVILPAGTPMGRQRIEVDFTDSRTGKTFVQDFHVDVVVQTPVALTRQEITRGQLIESSMIRVVTRPLRSPQNIASSDFVVGSTASRDIPSNQVVLASYVTKTLSGKRPVVQRGDLLDVIVPVRTGQIRLKNAKAMSAGAAGDSITIMNTRSKRELNAIVIDRNHAKVYLPGGSNVVR